MPGFGSEGPRDLGSVEVEHHSISGLRKDGLPGRRATQRHPVVLAASAQAIDRSSSVVVADLSSQGAKLQGRHLPASDREVLITTGTFAVFATVAWSAKDECGLSFDPPLNDDLLARFEQEGKWATMMGIV